MVVVVLVSDHSEYSLRSHAILLDHLLHLLSNSEQVVVLSEEGVHLDGAWEFVG